MTDSLYSARALTHMAKGANLLRDRVAGMPAVPANIQPEVRQYLEAIKEVLETLHGDRGSGLDASITWRDLMRLGLVKTQAGGPGSGTGVGIAPAGEHGTLSGLGDDDHEQYARNERNRVVIHSFDEEVGDMILWNGQEWINYTTNGLIHATGVEVDAAGEHTTKLLYNQTSKTVTLAAADWVFEDLSDPQNPIAASGSTFNIYIRGRRYTFDAPQELAHSETTGGSYLFFNEVGVFTISSDPCNVLREAPIAYVYFDSISGFGVVLDMRHYAGRDVHWQKSHRDNVGTTSGAGFAATGYVFEDGSTDDAVTWALSSGRIESADVFIDTQAVVDNGPYTGLTRTGSGDWTITRGMTLPFFHFGGYLQFNQLAGTWGLANVPDGHYLNVYVFGLPALPTTAVTPSPTSPTQIIVIPGQRTYELLSDANSETTSALDWGTFPFPDMAPLYQITIHYKATGLGAYANTAKCALIEAVRLYGNYVEIPRLAPSEHGTLSGLDEDDHKKYALTTGEKRVEFIVDAPVNGDYLVFNQETEAFKTRPILPIYPSIASFPAEGSENTLYVDEAAQKTYRWNGVIYEEVGQESSFRSFVAYPIDSDFPAVGEYGVIYADVQSKRIYRYTGSGYTPIVSNSSITASDTAPANPNTGDLWWDSTNAVLFIYYDDGDSSQWVDISRGVGGSASGNHITASDAAPVGPAEGDLWWDTANAILFIYFNDGSSSQWVDISRGIGGGSGSGITAHSALTDLLEDDHTQYALTTGATRAEIHAGTVSDKMALCFDSATTSFRPRFVSHKELTDVLGGDTGPQAAYHLKLSEIVGLTTGVETGLHKHNHANMTSILGGDGYIIVGSDPGAYHLKYSELFGLTFGNATTLHKHDHGGMDGLADDDHQQYVKTVGPTRVSITTDSAATTIYMALFWDGDKYAPRKVSHSELSDVLGGDLFGAKHLTALEYNELTDGGDTTLHKHDHGNLTGLEDDDHSIYAKSEGDTRAIVFTNHDPFLDNAPLCYDSATKKYQARFISHEELSAPSLFGGDAFNGRWHLTAAQHTDLTTGIATALHKHEHNNQDGLQGGTTSQYYHLTLSHHSELTGGNSTAIHKHEHNNLSSIQGGDSTSGQYYHLKESEHTSLTTNAAPSEIHHHKHNQMADMDGGQAATFYTAAEFFHLTAAQYGDLTDFGATTLHRHSHNNQDDLQGGSGAERYHLTNYQHSQLTGSGATTLHKHDHGNMDGLGDDDHQQYVRSTGQWRAVIKADLSNTLPGYVLAWDHIQSCFLPVSFIERLTPAGGTTGQVLTKLSNVDFNYQWATPQYPPPGGGIGQVLVKLSGADYNYGWGSVVANSPPSGGSAGQVLTKNSSSNYDYSWQTIVAGGSASVTISDTAPSSPSSGDLWWNSVEAILFIYFNDGTSSQWVDVSRGLGGGGSSSGSAVTASDTAPVGPSNGDLWWDSTNAIMFIYFNDGTSSQWVDISSGSGVGSGSPFVGLALSQEYADDASAAVGGVEIGELYRTGSIVKVRVT